MEIGNYKIETFDSLNICLYKKRIMKKKGKEGKIAWDCIGYFSNLKSALKSLANRKINETKLKDFETIVKKQDEIYKLIEEMK